MIAAKPSVESVSEALRAAVPTLDPGEQRIALQLYRMLLAGKPVSPADVASNVGAVVEDVEAGLAGRGCSATGRAGSSASGAWLFEGCHIGWRPKPATSPPGAPLIR